MTATRYQGRLRKWNTERSYGFILASDSGQDVFVHISAFPRDGRVPQEGDELSFEVEPDNRGRKQAVRVQHLGVTPPARATTSRPSTRSQRLSHNTDGASWGSKLIGWVVLAALAGYGYSQYDKHIAHNKVQVSTPATALAPTQSSTSTFGCDGRTHCSQMTSCSEAKYFLKHCPGVEIDGNHDGVPCEQQWCTTAGAR